MENHLQVLNSDAVNKYNMKFTIPSLLGALEQSWIMGVPSLISHDYHRPIGWTHGLSLYIESGLTRLIGIRSIPETGDESSDIRKAVLGHYRKAIIENHQKYKELIDKTIKPLLSNKSVPCMTDCVAFYEKGIVVKTFPELFAKKDKDGLIELSLLNQIYPGVYSVNGLLLFAHPYYRKSFSRLNSLNTPFLEIISKLVTQPGLTIKVALDEDMIGLPQSYKQRIELEYWWGPKFNDDLSKIKLGVAKYEATERERFFHGISRTEFGWYIQDDKKTFECEELRNIPNYGVGNNVFGCRFVHSMLDGKTNAPAHIDGAVREYTEDFLIQRLDSDIAHSGRHTNYKKLWRIDGKLSVAGWKSIITNYFKDNYLIGEYLGAAKEGIIAQETEEQPENNIFSFVPTNMNAGDGIKVSISYREINEGSEEERVIISLDTLTLNDKTLRYVERDTIEAIKIIRRLGGKIDLSGDSVIVAFQDYTSNFPLIVHAGENPVRSAQLTQDAFKILFDKWAEEGKNRLISYNIGIKYNEKIIVFSFAGHITDILQWLSSVKTCYPPDENVIGDWCEDLSKSLAALFIPNIDTPSVNNILKNDGILLHSRVILEPGTYTIKYDDEKGAPDIVFRIPKEDKVLCDLCKNEIIAPSQFIWEKSIHCSKCKSSYIDCTCSKYMDKDLQILIQDFELLGLFWTTRKEPINIV